MLAFSPNGKIVATTGEDRTLRLWSAATGTPLGPVFATAGDHHVARFQP